MDVQEHVWKSAGILQVMCTTTSTEKIVTGDKEQVANVDVIFFANALLSFSQETQRDTFIENCLLCIFWTFMIVLCIKILSFKLCLYKEKT